jgi:hypothetical protein
MHWYTRRVLYIKLAALAFGLLAVIAYCLTVR